MACGGKLFFVLIFVSFYQEKEKAFPAAIERADVVM
jgi:hypothetical protein